MHFSILYLLFLTFFLNFMVYRVGVGINIIGKPLSPARRVRDNTACCCYTATAKLLHQCRIKSGIDLMFLKALQTLLLELLYFY